MRTLAERVPERRRPTCDDVILRQGLCVLLLPLALHHAQHGPPAGDRKVGGQTLFFLSLEEKETQLFMFLSEPGLKTCGSDPTLKGRLRASLSV